MESQLQAPDSSLKIELSEEEISQFPGEPNPEYVGMGDSITVDKEETRYIATDAFSSCIATIIEYDGKVFFAHSTPSNIDPEIPALEDGPVHSTHVEEFYEELADDKNIGFEVTILPGYTSNEDLYKGILNSLEDSPNNISLDGVTEVSIQDTPAIVYDTKTGKFFEYDIPESWSKTQDDQYSDIYTEIAD